MLEYKGYLGAVDAEDAERGEMPDRPYSGRIPLRIEPELHHKAAARVQTEGMSFNQA